ncbi:MAG: class I SAM-dependent methyltransferase [Nitrospirota bacterium]
MPMRTVRNVYRLWTQYTLCPRSVQFRVLIRFLTCPFEKFLEVLPKTGRILDVGCGDGQLLFWLTEEPGSQHKAVGIDFDQDKINHARKVAIPRTEFFSHDIGLLSSATFDAVCISHVMYLIPINLWPGLLKECFRVLKAGGKLVIMESVAKHSWKSHLAHVQELISVYVTRMTKGEMVASWPVETYRQMIEEAGGCPVLVEKIDSGFLHPHVLFSTTK